LPVKARSELVIPRNPLGDTALPTTFMFEVNSPASNRPDLRSLRGSIAGFAAVCGFLAGAQAARATAAPASMMRVVEKFMRCVRKGGRWE
jgi:hypothetical protein